MGKLLIASVAVLFLLEGVQSLNPGDDCTVSTRRRLLAVGNCGDAGLDCEAVDSSGRKCKILAGGQCDPDEDHCVDGSFCHKDSICKVKVGEQCTLGVTAHCVENASCNDGDSDTCQCDGEFEANDDKTECSGGLAGALVSLTLMTASFLVSRLL